ncbi:MAG: DUF3352 domain-containing protein [Cyanobium sp.]
MKGRPFLAVVLAVVLLFFSLGLAGWWLIGQRGPLQLAHHALTIPRAARFVPAQAPLSLYWFSDGEQPVAYARAVAPARQRRPAGEAIARLRDGAFAAAGLDYHDELSQWLAPGIALVLFDTPAAVSPQAAGSGLPAGGWLLALPSRGGDGGARRFLQRFWQTRSLAGTDLQVSSYRGMGLISGRGALVGSRSVPLATALVEDDLVLIASGRGVLEQALDVSQIDELNQASQPGLQRELDRLGEGAALLLARPQALEQWLGWPLPAAAAQRPTQLVASLRPQGRSVVLHGHLQLPAPVRAIAAASPALANPAPLVSTPAVSDPTPSATTASTSTAPTPELSTPTASPPAAPLPAASLPAASPAPSLGAGALAAEPDLPGTPPPGPSAADSPAASAIDRAALTSPVAPDPTSPAAAAPVPVAAEIPAPGGSASTSLAPAPLSLQAREPGAAEPLAPAPLRPADPAQHQQLLAGLRGQLTSLLVLHDPAAQLQQPLWRPLLQRALASTVGAGPLPGAAEPVGDAAETVAPAGDTAPAAAQKRPAAGRRGQGSGDRRPSTGAQRPAPREPSAAGPIPLLVAERAAGPLLLAAGPRGWQMGTASDQPAPELLQPALTAEGLIQAPLQLGDRSLQVWTRLEASGQRSSRAGAAGEILQAPLAAWRQVSGPLARWGRNLALLDEPEAGRGSQELQAALVALDEAEAPLQWALTGVPTRELLRSWGPWQLLSALAGGGLDGSLRGLALAIEPEGRTLHLQARLSFER